MKKMDSLVAKYLLITIEILLMIANCCHLIESIEKSSPEASLKLETSQDSVSLIIKILTQIA